MHQRPEDQPSEPTQEQLRATPGFMSYIDYKYLKRRLVHIADVTGYGEDLQLGSGSRTLILAQEEAHADVVKQANKFSATHILITGEKPHEVFTWAHTTQASLYRRAQGQLPQPKQQP